MISTSEIKISVVIDEKYIELAVRVLHKAFELEKAPGVSAGFLSADFSPANGRGRAGRGDCGSPVQCAPTGDVAEWSKALPC